MNVLVDTCVWSLSLRRRREDLDQDELRTVKALISVIERGNARILGVVRQELLSGIKTSQQFEKVRKKLEAFPDVEITPEDYVEAARLGNLCRSKGVSVTLVDMVLCATAKERGWRIFSTDPDFARYSGILGVKLHEYQGHE